MDPPKNFLLDSLKKKKNLKIIYGIGATVHIGQKIQCLPYVGFFHPLIKIVWHCKCPYEAPQYT